MTPEQQRIAIAEWMGVKPTQARKLEDGKTVLIYLEDGKWLPDYLNDLNAMHEAEKKLDYKQRVIFINFLAVALVREHKPKLSNMTTCIHVESCHSTASQRAEALLKTIGKWKE